MHLKDICRRNSKMALKFEQARTCNSTQPRQTLQMFADHYYPRQTHTIRTFIQRLLHPHGELYPIQTRLTITAGISPSCIRVSMRCSMQRVPCPQKLQEHSIFTRALVLMELELTTSRTYGLTQRLSYGMINDQEPLALIVIFFCYIF